MYYLSLGVISGVSCLTFLALDSHIFVLAREAYAVVMACARLLGTYFEGMD